MRPFRPVHSRPFRPGLANRQYSESAIARTATVCKNLSLPSGSLVSSSQRVHLQLGGAYHISQPIQQESAGPRSRRLFVYVLTAPWAGRRGSRLD